MSHPEYLGTGLKLTKRLKPSLCFYSNIKALTYFRNKKSSSLMILLKISATNLMYFRYSPVCCYCTAVTVFEMRT